MSTKEQTFAEVCSKIDDIKMELISLVGTLEEAEIIRKAKSLDGIIGELEHWEHTNL